MKTLLSFHIATILCLISASVGKAQVHADDVWCAYDSFNRQFLDSAKYIYKNTTSDAVAVDRWNGAAAIWCQPMFVDMALNAMELAEAQGDSNRSNEYRDLSNKLIDGNISHYLGFDFDNNDTNRGWFIYDDIQWWTITLARASELLHREDCRELAEKSFARVWYGSPEVGDTGSYADPSGNLGGGMFWQWQPIENPKANAAADGKMSCINFPTVIAAMMLYNITPEGRGEDMNPLVWSNAAGDFRRPAYETKERYLEMAKEIYEWSSANLGDMETGRISDHSHGGNKGGNPLLYNQGTFIGASAMLFLATGDEKYLANANAGARYSISVMTGEDGMLPWAHNERDPYSQGSLEQGIYPAIWGQYMKLLTDACGQSDFLPVIERNVEAGWRTRDKSRNLSDGELGKPTPKGAFMGSYAASSLPALMLLFSRR